MWALVWSDIWTVVALDADDWGRDVGSASSCFTPSAFSLARASSSLFSSRGANEDGA
jgi:hypothetical protein